jgi:hypothetical protein
MKSLLLAAALLLSANAAHANPSEFLECNTGDSLDYVSVGVNSADEKSDAILLSVNYLSEKQDSLRADLAKGTLQKQIKAGSLILSFRSPESSDFGGSTDKAALLALTKSGKAYKGHLAHNGVVYHLTCTQAN